jgi:hypothetical protein
MLRSRPSSGSLVKVTFKKSVKARRYGLCGGVAAFMRGYKERMSGISCIATEAAASCIIYT